MPLPFHVLLLLLATGASGGWIEKGKTREVHIQQGLIRGFVAGWDNPNLRPVQIFLGIPYAAAPVGSLRYMPPQSPQTWGNEDGPVKMALDYAPVCPQILPTIDRDRKKMTVGHANYLKRLISYLKVQSEDCLTLNIFAPLQDGTYGVVKKSVMVFIHGESFSWNSGNPYDGSVLASYGDVIVVTLNFRLGVLGFLQSSSKVSNLGLLDQIAALKWLKDNIIEFGGDPNSVTLMGHHTGAIAVNHLMFSPIIIADPTPRLFQRVILMSGSALASWSVMKDPERNKRTVAEQLNCDPSDDDSFQECLREKSVGELLNLNFPDEFGPSLGDMVLAREDLKTSPQFKELYSRYDLLCGITENECYHFLDSVSLHNGMLEEDRDRVLTDFFNSTFQTYSSLIQNRATEFYSKVGLTFRGQTPITAREAVLGILNDVRVVNPVIQTALRHTSSSRDAQTFLYVFSHKSSNSEYTGTDRSVHGEELPYIFGVPLGGPSSLFQTGYSNNERLLSEVIMTMWSNFAKTGDPNSPKKYNYLSLSAKDWAYFEKLKWPLFEPVNQSYYKLEFRPSSGSWYRGEYLEFWNTDLPNYLRRHESNLRSHEGNLFFPFINQKKPASSVPVQPPPRHFVPMSRPEIPVRSFPPNGPYGTVHTHSSSEPRDSRRPGSFYKLATLKPRAEVMEEGIPRETMDEEQTEKRDGNDHVNSASSFALSILLVVGLAFIVVNLFLFVFFIRQKRKLCLSSRYPPPFGCGASPSLPDSNAEPRDEKFEIKSILKSADQLYDAVLKRTNGDEWPDIYRPCSSSTVTIDPHTKVAEWMGQKVKNTNLKQGNFDRNRTDKSSDTDNVSTATTSKAAEKRAVKKVSVAIDATPSTRSASVLKQIPIELTKSLDCGKYGFGGKLKRDRTISEDESPLPSHKHSLSDPADFPPPPATPSTERVLKSFNPYPEDEKNVNVTSREEYSPLLPMSAEEALDNIKKRNFPKVLPDFPDDEPEGAARLSKRLSLPQPAEALKELYKKNPPPPPPRTSTLARKSNRSTVPNSSTTDKDMEGVLDHSKPKKAEKRQEPRVIIKPTLTDPNAKKNANSKIPRVTSKNPEKQPPPSPSTPSKHAQVKDPPKRPPGGVGAKLKVHPVKKTSSTETATTSGTSGSSSSASTVKKGGH